MPAVVPGTERHPHARAVLGAALGPDGSPNHAYLFHGPAGSGKRAVARTFAAALLSDGAPDPENAAQRVQNDVHPDLSWVRPSGWAEMRVEDIKPVVTAVAHTPFESRRRVFVIERVDTMHEAAANRMLKTLEEPAPYVHLILLTDRLGEILPTIRSRCQAVRFEAPTEEQAAAAVQELGASAETARACVRLSLQDAAHARELAGPEGQALRGAAEAYARAAIAGEMASSRPWTDLLEAVRARGGAAGTELEARAAAELELVPRKERKRLETEWTDRIRRVRRRVQTGALDLALQLVSLWFADLACLAWNAPELVRNLDRTEALEADAAHGPAPDSLRRAIELVEETRERFLLNVSEDLACEALAYRLQDTLER